MKLHTANLGSHTDFHGRPRWRLHWIAVLAACSFVILFTILSSGILNLQQRIVDVTNETRDAMVPKLLAQLRTVRNLEMLRHYGSLAAKATDPTVRQDAAFLASMAALSPLIDGDTSTQRLVNDANRLIRDIAARESDPALWPAMEDRLTQRADDITTESGHMALQRATDIRDDSLLVRNIAVTMFLLFTLSTLVALVLGRFVVTDMRSKQQLFSEASHDFRQRLHGMQLLINSAQRRRLQGGADIVLRLKAINADLQRYLENFLELARLDVGMRNKKPKNCLLDLQGIFQRLEFQF